MFPSTLHRHWHLTCKQSLLLSYSSLFSFLFGFVRLRKFYINPNNRFCATMNLWKIPIRHLFHVCLCLNSIMSGCCKWDENCHFVSQSRINIQHVSTKWKCLHEHKQCDVCFFSGFFIVCLQLWRILLFFPLQPTPPRHSKTSSHKHMIIKF